MGSYLEYKQVRLKFKRIYQVQMNGTKIGYKMTRLNYMYDIMIGLVF